MDTILTIVQVAVSSLLILVILLQSRTTGLSATFGGSGSTYVQRRGAEKLLYQMTIVLSVIFFTLSVLHWYV